MKNLFWVFLAILSISCVHKDIKDNTSLITQETTIDSNLISHQVKENDITEKLKDTIILNNLDDCLEFFNEYKYYPTEFIDRYDLLEIKSHNQLKLFDKTSYNSFILIYSYSIEYEEGRINIVLCDSVGHIFQREYINQIYESIEITAQNKDRYRVYGTNPSESLGLSDNLHYNDSEYDFDFFVNIISKDSMKIGQ